LKDKKCITLKSLLKYHIKKLLNSLLNYSGLRHFVFHYNVSNEFIKWINDFKPDYIYSQLSSRDLIRLVADLSDITNIPIAIHIMDDWPSTISSKGLFKEYWKKKINNEFLGLLDKSSIFLSISKYMSDEYLIRYGKFFIPFHNPLDLTRWDGDSIKDSREGGSFNFLYAGRIGLGIMNSLLKFIETLESLNDQNISVHLYIQSSDIDLRFEKKISRYKCVKINPPVEYKKVPQIIKNADALVLCNDFDKEGKAFLKYSMPTKASEYMISKVPILLFSDSSSAVYRHAEENGWAYLVGDNDTFLLRSAILDLMENEVLREALVKKAFQYAKENFDSKIVRGKFLSVFNKVEYV